MSKPSKNPHRMMGKLIGLSQHKRTEFWLWAGNRFVPVTVVGMEYMASVEEQM